MNTHALTMVGVATSELDLEGDEYKGDLQRTLHMLNGNKYFAIEVWPLPPGKRLGDFRLKDYDHEQFVQAGGTATAMVIEVGITDADGYRLCRLGRSRHVGQQEQVVLTEGRLEGTTGFPDEVFDAEEATGIFIAWVDTGKVPDGYVLRELDLAQFASNA